MSIVQSFVRFSAEVEGALCPFAFRRHGKNDSFFAKGFCGFFLQTVVVSVLLSFSSGKVFFQTSEKCQLEMSLSKNSYCDGVDCCVLHVDGKWREVNMNCYLFRCSECRWEKMVKSYCFDGISRYL